MSTEKADTGDGPVHVGFILGAFSDSELFEYVDKDQDLFDKWITLKGHLKKYSIDDVAVKVSQGTHDLFQEILDLVQERYGLILPRHPSELK